MNQIEVEYRIFQEMINLGGENLTVEQIGEKCDFSINVISMQLSTWVQEGILFQPRGGSYSILEDNYLNELYDKIQEMRDQISEEDYIWYQISNSRFNTFKDCKRRGWFQYVAKIIGIVLGSKHLKLGKIVHNLIEDSMGVAINLRKDKMIKEISNQLKNIPDSQKDTIRNPLILMVDTLLSIPERYTIEKLEKHTTAIGREYEEGSFFYNIFEKLTTRREWEKDSKFIGIGIQGYIDAVVLEDGRRILQDWKTGQMNLRAIQKVTQQLRLYAHIERLLGERVDGAKGIFLSVGGVERTIDVDPALCQEVFETMINEFEKIFENGLDFKYFPPTFSKLCRTCDFNAQCHEIENMRNGILDNRFKSIVKELMVIE